MGNSLNCFGCLPATGGPAQGSEGVRTVEGEALEERVPPLPSGKLEASRAGSKPQPRSDRDGVAVGYPTPETEKLRTGSAVQAYHGHASSAQKSAGYIDVVRDPWMTTVGTSVATIIGLVVGIVTRSGWLGALTYLCTLTTLIVAGMYRAKKRTCSNVETSKTNGLKASAPLPPPFVSSPAGAVETTSKVEPGQVAKLGDVVEPRTGYSFPYLLYEDSVDATENVEVLAGIGLREKKVIAMTIDVYAVGIYVNAFQLKRSPLGSKFGPDYAESDSGLLMEDLIRETRTVSRTIRIVIKFAHLTSAMLVKQFDERLEKVMKRAGEPHVYQELRKGLSSVELRPGRIILLRMMTDGTLLAEALDESGVEILADTKSHALCQAVTDIYLGSDPASPEAKRDTQQRIRNAFNYCPAPPPPSGAAACAGNMDEERKAFVDALPVDSNEGTISDLSGTWKVTEAENVEELLVELGINFLVRKVALRLYTQDMKIIEQNGRVVTFTDYRSERKGVTVRLVEHEAFLRKDKQGKDLKDLAVWEGEKLHITTEGYETPLKSTYWRESSDTMISETETGGVVMKRTWKLM